MFLCVRSVSFILANFRTVFRRRGVGGEGGDCLCALDFPQTFAKFKFYCTNPRQTTATAPPIIHGLGYKNWEPPIYSVTVTLATVQFNHRTNLEPPIYSVTVTLDVVQLNARTTYSAVLQLEYTVTLFVPGKERLLQAPKSLDNPCHLLLTTTLSVYNLRPSKCLQHHYQRWCSIFWTGINLLL